MTLHLEFNARFASPSEIARSFVPPERHFSELMARNHTLVVGPRGSGKTTLFKMLSVKALRNWVHKNAAEYSRKISFNAAFIPADITWGKQLKGALQQLPFSEATREAAYTIHTLRSLVRAMREAVELDRMLPPEHLKHLSVHLSSTQEEKIVEIVSEAIGISPKLNSLLGVELALEGLLVNIANERMLQAFCVEKLPSTLSLVVSTFNGISGDGDRRWAMLFDEMEIMPTRIKQFLLSSLRSFDDRIIIKLAIAPFMDDVTLDPDPTSPHPLHDYKIIQLTYPNKEDAKSFTEELFYNTFDRLGFSITSLAELFACANLNNQDYSPEHSQLFHKNKKHSIPSEFIQLAEKDVTFKRYLETRGMLSPSYDFTERNVAKDIRKVRPIVNARNYFLKSYKDNHASHLRSRKANELYTGYPSLVDIAEGNPRAILTLVIPLARYLDAELQSGRQPRNIPTWLQGQMISRIELLLTSLLQVIPLDVSGFKPNRGLLDFVDQIGWSFEHRLLRQAFQADYVGSFVLDSNVSQDIVGAVGKALNAGAVIHVPYTGGGADSLLRGLAGQRFRLSYSLAARYKLLLTLGNQISLSKLLHETKGIDITDKQGVLFNLPSKDDQ